MHGVGRLCRLLALSVIPLPRSNWSLSGAKRTFAGSTSRYNFYERTPQSVFGAIRGLRIEHALIAEFERHRPGITKRHRTIKT